MNKKAIVTYIIIGINIIMFLLCVISSKSLIDIDVYTLANFGGQARILIDYNNEYWRLFTCMFLHGGLMHLFFNMYGLYYLGTQCEMIFGKIKYLIIYFSSGLIGAFLSYKLGDPRTVSVGASGAVFGLAAALLVFCAMNKDIINKNFMSNLILIIGLNLFIGFTQSGIDNFAHLGGILGGAIFGFIFTSTLKSKHNNY